MIPRLLPIAALLEEEVLGSEVEEPIEEGERLGALY